MSSQLKKLHSSTLTLFKALPCGKVLDIAAGAGVVATALSELGFKVTCCDINPQQCLDKGTACAKIDLNTDTLPYPDHSFNYVVFNESIQYLENPHFIMREISRVTSPQGVFITSLPNILNIQSRIKFLLNGYPEFFKPFYILPEDKAGLQRLGINPVGLVEFKYLLDRFGWRLQEVTASRYKKGIFLYSLLAVTLYAATIITTLFKKTPVKSMKRLLNSFPVLLGEGLTIVAVKSMETIHNE